jgi:hypothetical protein
LNIVFKLADRGPPKMLALDDGAIARILIAASKFPLAADRLRFLEKFAAAADPPRPRADQLAQMGHLSGGRAGGSPRRPRSPDAERMRRYRARLRRGVAYVPLPVTRLIVDYLVRGGLLPRDREAADRVEIGLAAAAALERAARADR